MGGWLARGQDIEGGEVAQYVRTWLTLGRRRGRHDEIISVRTMRLG